MDRLIHQVNETTKQKNNNDKIIEIEKRLDLTYSLYSKDRVFLFQGSVQEYPTPYGKGEPQHFIYYLFNDLLIRSTPLNHVHEPSIMDLFHPCTHDHTRLTLCSIIKSDHLLL